MASFLPTIPNDSSKFQRDDDYLMSSKGSPLRAPKTTSSERVADGQGRDLADESLSRRQIVFPDPVAFRYLEDDPCVKVIERRAILRGYELYLVEQWACSRQSPTLVVVTYTGDQTHSVVVGVLAVPQDEKLWSQRLRLYFKATHQYHARPKDTEIGELMVTNLSNFPSALTVIPVPDGEVRNHRQSFIVNEDLKRLGCSGRSGLTLTEPAEATQSKFQQLYKTSERISFSQSVIELVKLCQVALSLFEKLDHEYIDGLLCDVTETAIGNWWTEVGAEHYNFEPTDGILGPSTVAALLGMLMGARNRLHWYGAPVPKDVFDIESTKRGISYFQKSQKLEKTRRLNRQTLFRLHTATAKAASGEGWGVQKAVKSTVTEIGGKRGELVIGMVGGKDKAGLADVETLDIDRFVSLAYGERPKWLWYGKPRRTPAEHTDDPDLVNLPASKEDPLMSTTKKVHSLPPEEELDTKRRDEFGGITSVTTGGSVASANDSIGERDALRKAVFKSVAGKMSDAKSGLGRIKDAVGGSRKGHTRGPSSARDDYLDSGSGGAMLPTTGQGSSDPSTLGRAFTWKTKPEEYLNAIRKGDANLVGGFLEDHRESRDPSSSTTDSRQGRRPLHDKQRETRIDAALKAEGSDIPKDGKSLFSSISRLGVDMADLRGRPDTRHVALGRRYSVDNAKITSKRPNEARWPRRISFSDAEDAVLVWDDIFDLDSTPEDLVHYKALTEIAAQMRNQVNDIVQNVEPWVEENLKLISRLNDRYDHDKGSIEQTYLHLSEACQRVRSQAEEILAEERAHLTESVKEIEVLVARLDYEINALIQKVGDLEDGVRNFERQVEDAERRADNLKKQLETESWLHWVVRTMTGVGTGPNITKERESVKDDKIKTEAA